MPTAEEVSAMADHDTVRRWAEHWRWVAGGESMGRLDPQADEIDAASRILQAWLDNPEAEEPPGFSEAIRVVVAVAAQRERAQ